MPNNHAKMRVFVCVTDGRTHSLIRQRNLHFKDIVDALNGEDPLRDEEEISGIRVLPQQEQIVIIGIFVAHELIENVIISLDG